MTSRRAILWLLAGLAAGKERARSAAPGRERARRIPAWVTPGAPVTIQASIDGRRAEIHRVLGPQDDLLILLVLDLTGDLTLVDGARQAAGAAIDALPPNAWVGVLRAQDGLRVLHDPGPDRAATAAAIHGAQVSGRAGLLETVEPAARLATALVHKTGIRAAVLYLTDSNIYNYREDYTNPVINPSDTRDLSRRFPDLLIREKTAKIAAVLAASDAPVFAVHLAFLRDRLNEAYQTGLGQIVEATGGQAWFCHDLNEIPEAVQAAFARIRAMHAIDLRLPAGAPRNATLQIKAEGADWQYRNKLDTEGWTR